MITDMARPRPSPRGREFQGQFLDHRLAATVRSASSSLDGADAGGRSRHSILISTALPSAGRHPLNAQPGRAGAGGLAGWDQKPEARGLTKKRGVEKAWHWTAQEID